MLEALEDYLRAYLALQSAWGDVTSVLKFGTMADSAGIHHPIAVQNLTHIRESSLAPVVQHVD
jgi:hypothetical protein